MSGTQTCSTCIADIPEVYDPTLDTWTRLNSARRVHPALSVQLRATRTAGCWWQARITPRWRRPVLDVATQTWTTLDPDRPRRRQRGHVRARPHHEVRLVVGARGDDHAGRGDHVRDRHQPAVGALAADGADGLPAHLAQHHRPARRQRARHRGRPDRRRVQRGRGLAGRRDVVAGHRNVDDDGDQPGAPVLSLRRHTVAGRSRAGRRQRPRRSSISSAPRSTHRRTCSRAPARSSARPRLWSPYGGSFAVQTPDAARVAKVALIGAGVGHARVQREPAIRPAHVPGRGRRASPCRGRPIATWRRPATTCCSSSTQAACRRRRRWSASRLRPRIPAADGVVTAPASCIQRRRARSRSSRPRRTTRAWPVSSSRWIGTTSAPRTPRARTRSRGARGRCRTAPTRCRRWRATGRQLRVSADVVVVVANAVDTSPPTTPTGVTATAVATSQINVAWSAIHRQRGRRRLHRVPGRRRRGHGAGDDVLRYWPAAGRRPISTAWPRRWGR